jgi:hypothetical protein
MRNGQNKRMRGRNRKGGSSGGGGGSHHHHQNPLSRMYESNGPEVKIRGSASHVAEKYLQLARDAQSSGDPVAAENFYQHAEHYFRLIAAAQEQFRQNNPYYQPQQTQQSHGAGNFGDDSDEDGDDDGQPTMGGEPYAPQPQQNFYQREQQPQLQQPQPQQQPYPQREPQPSFSPRDGHQQQQQHQQPPQHSRAQQPHNDGDVDRLPSFITGGGQPSQQPAQSSNGTNGYDPQTGGGDRFPLHRRRRRHRGPRDQAMGGDAETPSPALPQPPND